MNKISKKNLFRIATLSIALNLVFLLTFFLIQNEKKNDLINALDRILYHIDFVSSLLNDGDHRGPNYEVNSRLAAMNIAESRILVDTYAQDMPRNLVSWIRGVELGLLNASLGVDEEGFKSSVQELGNFIDGYNKETENLQIGRDYKEILMIIDDVLGSQKYMGDNYMH